MSCKKIKRKTVTLCTSAKDRYVECFNKKMQPVAAGSGAAASEFELIWDAWAQVKTVSQYSNSRSAIHDFNGLNTEDFPTHVFKIEAFGFAVPSKGYQVKMDGVYYRVVSAVLVDEDNIMSIYAVKRGADDLINSAL